MSSVVSSLWPASDCTAWDAALASYPNVIVAQENLKLAEVDTWYREELPGLIRSRTPRSITLSELVQLTEWKMRRGVWRARNLVLVKGNSEADVVTASEEAFAAAPDALK